MDDKTLKTIQQLAEGYEVEEVQTMIEETPSGTKKKIIRHKKHIPANLEAIKYLEKMNQTNLSIDEQFKELRGLKNEN